jgi:hypothetical protein
VNHVGHKDLQFSPVTNRHLFEPCDIAVLEAVVEDPKWVQPFTGISGAANWGEAVTTIGWPVGVLADQDQEVLRIFRGFIQRAFLYTNSRGAKYSAYELNFPSPPGLSGSPLFADQAPRTLIGVITENFSTYTVEHTFEEERSNGGIVRTEARSVITYGVAVNPFHALEFLEAIIGVGNLNVAERE